MRSVRFVRWISLVFFSCLDYLKSTNLYVLKQLVGRPITSRSLRDEKQLGRETRPRLHEASEVTWIAESDCASGFSGSSEQGLVTRNILPGYEAV
jgi:hypothetical protein